MFGVVRFESSKHDSCVAGPFAKPLAMNESQYIKAVEEALADGATDAAEGGVSPQEIADRVNTSIPTAKRHLRRLAQDGRLCVVYGVDPDTFRPRKSYLPTDCNSRG